MGAALHHEGALGLLGAVKVVKGLIIDAEFVFIAVLDEVYQRFFNRGLELEALESGVKSSSHF